MGETRPVLTTVVIPASDDAAGPPLIEAVRSLRDQDTPLRVIIVNNALSVPLPVLPGVTIARSRERLSRGAAHNLGLARVSTPYVVFWEPHDVMPPQTIPRLEHAMEADNGLLALASRSPTGHERNRPPSSLATLLLSSPNVLALAQALGRVFPSEGPIIMRTDAVRAVGGYDDNGEPCGLISALSFRGKLGWNGPSETPAHGYVRRAPPRRNLRAELRHAATV